MKKLEQFGKKYEFTVVIIAMYIAGFLILFGADIIANLELGVISEIIEGMATTDDLIFGLNAWQTVLIAGVILIPIVFLIDRDINKK